jgi:enoyl-CoA hydratase
MEYKNVLVSIEQGICLIVINRPKALNALNSETLLEIRSAVKEAEDKQEVQAVILTGAGDRAFVAGADIAQMNGLDTLSGRKMALLGQQVFSEIENLDKPVIAAVNGFALGGGCELAMACDIRIASENAKFGQPEVNLGIIPGFGGTQRLPRLIGKGRAKYYIYTGELMSAHEAFITGLVNKVVPAGELLNTARQVATTIMSKAPVAVQMAKQAINNGMDVDLDSGIAYEAEAYSTCFGTSDRVEGMNAFLEKRAPVFRNQ